MAGLGQLATVRTKPSHRDSCKVRATVEGTDGSLAWRGTFIFLIPENGGAGCSTSGIGAVEQPRDERAAGDAAHMPVLVFAGEAFDRAHEDRDIQRLLHEGIHTQPHGFLVLMRSRSDDDHRYERTDAVK